MNIDMLPITFMIILPVIVGIKNPILSDNVVALPKKVCVQSMTVVIDII